MAGEANEKNGGNKKLLIIAVVVIVILLCAVGAMAALLISKNNEAQKPTQKERKEVVTAENVEEVIEQMEEEQQSIWDVPQNYTVTQNSEWHFSDGKTSADAYVMNDPENETPVYFDLTLDDTNEVIYSSPVLELGAEIKGFTLDKPLDAGTYKCTVVYHLVDDEQNELTTVNIGVSVIVEN